MVETEKLQQEIIDEFSSHVVQERYVQIAEHGLWESEEKLVTKYFSQGSSVLNIACGSGREAIPLHNAGFKVTGVDLTPKMIELAQKIARSKGLAIVYEVGDATRLRFEDSTFDNILFANNGWSQIPGKDHRLRSLQEAYRVLRPDGHFIFTANRRYYSPAYLLYWTKQFIQLFLKPLGFPAKAIEFGDLFYHRMHQGKRLDQQQFMHFGSVIEIRKQIAETGFQLVYSAPMGEISNSDAENMEGTLFPSDNAYKSPVFFICKK